jgi:hypothetical protein
MDDIIVLFNDFRDYEIINAKIQNGLHTLGLELNGSKTQLIDKENHDFKKVFYCEIRCSDSYHDVGAYFAVLYFDRTNEQKRYSFWEFPDFKRFVHDGWMIDNDELDSFFEEENPIHIRNLMEDIIGVQCLPGREIIWGYEEVLKQILLSNISVEMKMKIIKRQINDVYFTLLDNYSQYLNYFILKSHIQKCAFDSPPNINRLRKVILNHFGDSEYNLIKPIIEYFNE